MSSFNEENTVEQMVLDTLCGSQSGNMVAEEQEHNGDEIKGRRFESADELPRQHSDTW
jgi:type I restriction enzyme R subunit